MPHLEAVFGIPHPVALVTGSGAPRIGNCIVRTLAARGYRVAIHAQHSRAAAERTRDELLATGAEATTVVGDVSREVDVREMIAAVKRCFGRLDVLVNSAAIWQPRRFEEVTADDLRRHFDINTLGMFLCSKEDGGAIIQLGDWAVVRPYSDYAAYFPSKGAVISMTRSLAVELAARNPAIRVNAVLPGPVTLSPDLSDEERRRIVAGTLVRREGTPQHVADAVVSLVENDFINGVCLPVDGGRSIFAPPIE
jgi:pteridine reductase